MKSAVDLQYDMASALVAAMNDYAQIAGADSFTAAGNPPYDMAAPAEGDTMSRSIFSPNPGADGATTAGAADDEVIEAVPQVPPRTTIGGPEYDLESINFTGSPAKTSTAGTPRGHIAVNMRNSIVALDNAEYLVPGVDTKSGYAVANAVESAELDAAWDANDQVTSDPQKPTPAPRGNSLADVWKSALTDSAAEMGPEFEAQHEAAEQQQQQETVKSGAISMLAGGSASNVSNTDV